MNLFKLLFTKALEALSLTSFLPLLSIDIADEVSHQCQGGYGQANE